ncbi:MAG: heme exporter protein CcmD [Gammaproteobacteria bacterium]|nr:MAG: heme exporter protein CcmD [Gammaproteobacteria bacterium]
MSEFLNMGGYAIYVWPSYGLAALILWLNWYLPKRQHRQILRQLIRRNQDRNNETRT